MRTLAICLLYLGYIVLPGIPILGNDPGTLVFVVRHQYKQDHHNTATLFQTGEINHSSFTPGAALQVLSVESGEVTTLLSTQTGMIRDPEVSFDGDQILFSYRKNIDDDYHISG